MSATEVKLGRRDVLVEPGADGTLLLRHPEALAPYPVRFTERLEEWAARAPERVFLAERAGAGWRTLCFRDALGKVEAIAQALLDSNLGSDTPVMILAINSIDHALIALACLHVGIPSAPVSLAYVTHSNDFERFAHAVDRIRPAAIFTHDANLFATAINTVVPASVEIIATTGTIPGRSVTPFTALTQGVPGPRMARARDAVTGDTVARLIFTSGSSSLPKAVINTHRMLSSNQQMHAQVWRFLQETPPVLADWAPWNHTAGVNVALGVTVYFGGSLYIDDGRATAKDILRTVHNAAAARPTIYFGVPLVYQLITPILKSDPELRDGFFSRLQMLFYAGGTLPETVWDELRALMIESRGGHIYTCGGYGATEMSPSVLLSSWDAGRPGIVGLPVPGITLKLTPVGDKLEVRVKGPSVTPGYWRGEKETAAAFDEEGWYCTGDAVRFKDAGRPLEGLLYDGRLSENFKLSTGTWVSVAALRARAVQFLAPLVGDAVVVGHGQSEIGLVLFPILAAARQLAGCEDAADLRDLLGRSAFRAEMQNRLDALSRTGNSATTRITRALLVPEAPSATEVTDKNTLSFRGVMNKRERDILALYARHQGDRFLYAAATSSEAGST